MLERLGKRKRGIIEMDDLDSITDSMHIHLGKFQEVVEDRKGLVGSSQSWGPPDPT